MRIKSLMRSKLKLIRKDMQMPSKNITNQKNKCSAVLICYSLK